MHGALLEALAADLQCFISALPQAAFTPKMIYLLRKKLGEPYTLDEWRYCLYYLYHEHPVCSSFADVETFLDTIQRYS